MINTAKTVFLLTILTILTILTLLLVLGGRLLFGQGGMLIALAISVVMNVSAYWFSDKIALRMAGARPVTEEERVTRLERMAGTYLA